MKLSQIADILKSECDFLFSYQRAKIIDVMTDSTLLEQGNEREYDTVELTKFIDEVLRRMLGFTVLDFTPNEQTELAQVIRDFEEMKDFEEING